MGEIHPVIKRFYEATNKSSVSDLADSLGIRRQAVYSAMKTGTFPKEWYFKVSEMTDCSMDWLVHGTEPKMRPRPDHLPAEENFPNVLDSICDFLVGRSGNIYEKNRCKIQLCQKLESQQEEMTNSFMEKKKNSRINSIKRFASKISISNRA